MAQFGGFCNIQPKCVGEQLKFGRERLVHRLVEVAALAATAAPCPARTSPPAAVPVPPAQPGTTAAAPPPQPSAPPAAAQRRRHAPPAARPPPAADTRRSRTAPRARAGSAGRAWSRTA